MIESFGQIVLIQFKQKKSEMLINLMELKKLNFCSIILKKYFKLEKLIKILALCVLAVGLVKADPIWEDANLDTVSLLC